MSIISTIRKVLGIEDAEKRAEAAAKQQTEMMSAMQAMMAAITAMNKPKTAGSQQEAAQETAQKAALEAEIIRLKAEGEELRAEIKKAQETAQKASISAVKDYLAALRQQLDEQKAEKKPVDGRNFCIRFDEATAERLLFLQNLFRSQKLTWKLTTFVNEAVATALQRVFDEYPDLEIRLKQSLDDALQLAASDDQGAAVEG